MTAIYLMYEYDAFAFLQRINVPDDCDKHESNGRTL